MNSHNRNKVYTHDKRLIYVNNHDLQEINFVHVPYQRSIRSFDVNIYAYVLVLYLYFHNITCIYDIIYVPAWYPIHSYISDIQIEFTSLITSMSENKSTSI